MGFDRSAYVEANPKLRQYAVGGITFTVAQDAAFDMLKIFKAHGLKILSEKEISAVILDKGRRVFAELARGIIIDPPICSTPEEAAEKNGLTVEELNPRHLNGLIGQLMADWTSDEEAGTTEAAAFRSPEAGHGAGAARPGVPPSTP